MNREFLNNRYASPDCGAVEMCAWDAILADSYYSGGGGSFTDDDIVDNGNY
ncbi:MAG: hypothetical protein J5871_03390 [Bacteroidales bacterium]|nr:hypothetical protein [Bacteroidales bacterium]